jgi:hypothetical protein
MRQEGKARLCEQCDKLVHDLSGMTERAARALLRGPRNEGLCIRYLRDRDGNIWFGDSPDPILSPSRLVVRRIAAAAGVAALASAPALIEACGGASPYDGVYAPYVDGGSDGSPEPTVATPGVAAPDAGSGD